MLPSTIAPGKIIGDKVQYRLESSVAVGAFSTVYRCTELSTKRTYAMKIIDKKVAADNHMKEALIREVNALEIAGRSPYVTTLVDKMVSRHNYYLVMELAEGGTLLDLIREQRQELRVLQASLSARRDLSESLRSVVPPVMQYDRVQHFFKQLLLALSSLHDRDVVHRDVKPENILLNKRRTRLVLSDFGFACHAPPGTVLHRACGTLRYCAPELLSENPHYDGRKVDVWAAGVTLYVMLFGGHPFRCPQQDPDALLEVITTTPFRIPRPIPAEAEDMLQHMLCVSPEKRWSVKQLLQHPWMASLGAELRSPAALSSSSTRNFTSAAAGASPSSLPPKHVDTTESMVELLSEDCPPIDAIPSDEELVDDGFYHCSTDEQQSSISSGSPVRSGVSTHLSTPSAANPKTACTAKALDAQALLEPTEPSGVAPVVPAFPAMMSSRTSIASAPSDTAAAAKREVLQQGSVSTSMVSIESCADSDDEHATHPDDDDALNGDEAAYDTRAASACSAHRTSSDLGSSFSTNNTYSDDGQLEIWWVRYTYAVFLTARIVTRFIAFSTVCVVAVAVRVVLRRDIVDLPLPEFIRNYISFLLSTPLRRSHLAAHHQQQPQAVSRELPSLLASTKLGSFSTLVVSKSQRTSLPGGVPNSDTIPNKQASASPLPGSGLRHYVRTADQLMRDSFVGNAVLERNASLADVRAAASFSLKEPSQESYTSSPAAPSLATVAPAPASRAQSIVVAEGLSTTPLMTVRSARGDWIETPEAHESGGELRCNSAEPPSKERAATGDAAVVHTADASALASTHSSPLVTFVTPSSSLILESVGPAKLAKRTSACARGAAKHKDLQAGATDTTESGDGATEKMTDVAARLQYLVSPSAPLPRTFPGHRQRSEDFPLLNDTPAT